MKAPKKASKIAERPSERICQIYCERGGIWTGPQIRDVMAYLNEQWERNQRRSQQRGKKSTTR